MLRTRQIHDYIYCPETSIISSPKPHWSSETDPRIRLRVLATSDLHCNIWPFDYGTDTALAGVGLAALAPLIRQARAEEAENCILLDNGDFLQGTALADLYVQDDPVAPAHPMITAMNALGYDAGTLGNHDFNFGLPALETALSNAAFPFVSANLVRMLGAKPTEDSAFLPPFIVLERNLTASDGNTYPVRIGVIGAAPPQTVKWDAAHLSERLYSRGIKAAIAAHLPNMQAAGVDLIVALSHSGLGPADAEDGAEDASLSLSGLDGIDVIIAGHSHKTLPGNDFSGCQGVDADRGRLGDIPSVMPGAFGSHLGQVDLDLIRHEGRWRPVHADCAVHASPARKMPPDGTVMNMTRAAHQATRKATGTIVGQTKTRLHGVFALVAHAPVLQFVADAQLWRARQLLEGLDHQDLPLVSAVAPFKSGGQAGPLAYTDIAPGPLRLGHMTEVFPFPNSLCVVEITGAALRHWLDRAAALFRTVPDGSRDAPLIVDGAPGYNFDILHGLSYSFDLTHPARYSATDGRLINPSTASRVVDLTLGGRPVGDSDRLLVATNTYRLAGGGGFDMVAKARAIAVSPDVLRDDLIAYVQACTPIFLDPAPVWGFRQTNATTTFDGRPDSPLDRYGDRDRRIEPVELQADGAMRYRLDLSPATAQALDTLEPEQL